MRPIISLLLPLFVASIACGDNAATTQDAPWGARTSDLQSRITLPASLTKGAPVAATAEIRNVSDKPVPLLNVRIWLMIAQGPDHVFYSAPFDGPKKQDLDAGQQIEIHFDAGELPVYRYVPTLIIRNGVPVPPPSKDKAAPPPPSPASIGKLSELLPIGAIKAKAFLIANVPITLSEQQHVSIIPSASVTLTVQEPDVATMTTAEQQATFDEIAGLFRSDAVAGKNGHDRAVHIGKPIIPRLVALLSDDGVTDAGRMWLTAALIDLHDDHTVAALTSILNKGGSGAYVVAYMGPKMHDPGLTAAINKAARTTKDPTLTAWAARGLGLAGDPIDPKMLEPMVVHSDAAGRAEAADILAADEDAHALPLLARLIADDDLAVRLHAAKAAADHNLGSPSILKALEAMAHRADSPSQAAANDALSRITTK
jgi:hypothetical protein